MNNLDEAFKNNKKKVDEQPLEERETNKDMHTEMNDIDKKPLDDTLIPPGRATEIEKLQATIEKEMGLQQDIYVNSPYPADEHGEAMKETPLEQDSKPPELSPNIVPPVQNPMEREIHTYPSTNSHNQPITAKITENIKDKETGTTGGFKKTIAIVAIIAVLGGGFLGLGFALGSYVGPNWFKADIETEPFAFEPKMQTGKVEYSENTFAREGFADLIDKVDPFVVSIHAKRTASENAMFAFPNIEEGSSGSGILFHESNDLYYVLTNSHVISGAQSVAVSVSGSSPVNAALVGKREEADLAIVSINKADLKSLGITQVTLAHFGDSDSMRVGDFVLAIGNSMGEGNTATNGMISAKDKIIYTEKAELTVLQTNAAINPGNSGGPLVNLDGEVIGVTTAKMADGSQGFLGETSSAVEGMGYAIPSNIVMEITEELMSGKEKAALGVSIYNMTEEIAKQYNLPQAGAVVSSVEPDSAADKAGVQRMDVITGFNGESIMSPEQLVEVMKTCQVGDEVEIKIVTSTGDMKTLKAILQTAAKDTF